MEPQPAPHSHAGRRLPFALLCLSLCAIIVVAVVCAATHSLTISLRGAPFAAATPYPATRPCSLGALPPDAPATGGIVAVLVSSVYQAPNPPRLEHYQAPPPSAPPVYALCVLRASDGAELALDTLAGTQLTPYQANALAIAPDGSAIYVAGTKAANPGSSSGTGRVCAMHPRPEAVLWCQDLDSNTFGELALGESALYLVTGRSIDALDAHSGAVLWRASAAVVNTLEPPLHVDGGLVVAVTGDDVAVDDRVCAWHTRNGTPAWCTNTFEDLSVRHLAAGDGFVTLALSFADGTGLVEQLAESDGHVGWQRKVTESLVAGVADAAGVVYVAPDQCFGGDAACHGQVLLLQATTGAPLGAFTVYGELAAFAVVESAAVYGTPAGIAATLEPLSPAPANWVYRPPKPQRLGFLVSSRGAVLYAGSAGIGLLDLASGRQIWQADACGDRLAGAATSQQGTGAVLSWCHWPPGTQIYLLAIQGAAA